MNDKYIYTKKTHKKWKNKRVGYGGDHDVGIGGGDDIGDGKQLVTKCLQRVKPLICIVSFNPNVMTKKLQPNDAEFIVYLNLENFVNDNILVPIIYRERLDRNLTTVFERERFLICAFKGVTMFSMYFLIEGFLQLQFIKIVHPLHSNDIRTCIK